MFCFCNGVITCKKKFFSVLSIRPITLDNNSDGEGNDSILEFKSARKKKSRKKPSFGKDDDFAIEAIKIKGKKVEALHTEQCSSPNEEDIQKSKRPTIISEEPENDGQTISQLVERFHRPESSSQSNVQDKLCTGFHNRDDCGNASKVNTHSINDFSEQQISSSTCVNTPCTNKRSSISDKEDVIVLSNSEDMVEPKESQSTGRVHSPSVEGKTDVTNLSDIESGSQSAGNVGKDVWSCSACTFHNHQDLPYCEMCSTPQPRPKRTVQAQGDRTSSIVRKSKRSKARKTLLSPTTPPPECKTSVNAETIVLGDDCVASKLESAVTNRNHLARRSNEKKIQQEISEKSGEIQIFDEGVSKESEALYNSDIDEISKNAHQSLKPDKIMEYNSDSELFSSSNSSSQNQNCNTSTPLSCTDEKGERASLSNISKTSHSCISSQRNSKVNSSAFNKVRSQIRDHHMASRDLSDEDITQTSSQTNSHQNSLHIISDENMAESQQATRNCRLLHPTSDNDLTPMSKQAKSYNKSAHDISDDGETTSASSQTISYVEDDHDSTYMEDTSSLNQSRSYHKGVRDMSDDSSSVSSPTIDHCRGIHDISDEYDSTPVASKTTSVKTPSQNPLSESIDDIMAEETEAAKVLFSPKSKKRLMLQGEG